MAKKNRLRFAPSPTGPLHIGGLRTALFNYLFAKKTGGELILRIEDTDQARRVERSQEHIENSLSWVGINFDESSAKGGNHGPYNQSERKSIYRKHVDLLIKKGAAYYAFDKKERLDFHRKDHEKKGKKFIYNSHNRLKLDNSLSLSEAEIADRISKEEYVVRFKTPAETEVELNDVIRGDITVSTRDIDDKILFKSDGMPTYHLANVVDDHLMEITHVIRGEEWLPSLALHVLLYKAFGWDNPLFAHLPLILKPSGKGKLSKRDGDKFGFPVYALDWVEEKTYTGFSEAGFLPEALVNYMAFLGWSPDDEKELYSIDELIKDFTLEKINKSGGKFDPKKLVWLNSQHIQQLDKQALSEICLLKNKDIDNTRMEDFIGLVQPRMDSIAGLKNQFLYLFNRPEVDTALIQKMKSPEAINAVNEFTEALVSEKLIDTAKTKNTLYSCAEKHGAKFGKVMGFCRACIVGKMEGPDVIKMMFFIGLEETLIRLKESLNC